MDALCAAMKRKKFSFVFCVDAVLFCCVGCMPPMTAQNLPNNIAVNKFQSALQQQNYYTILTSIEERLRNLDNIYAMQLSQTLETKLDLYSRRLESLDTKIIRLEALVMLNLDKISENISTKNFKDDVSTTTAMRKIDAVYEGINHRLGYMDRKYDTHFAKVQSKMDSTLARLGKLEESLTTRDSDIEAELSDAIFAIDDLKTTCNLMEGKLLNITSATYNITTDSFGLLKDMNLDNEMALNKLHNSIVENLELMHNKTSLQFKTTEENNIMLKRMKIELKEDFNDYANKVADMNSYIWKNGDSTEDDLKLVATVVNSTKTEVQNGIRALMLQIGKLSSKDITPSGSNSLSEINNKLTTNFEKILSNQDLFLESCHRVQMDESQIESEISVMLEKLIDMLEKKMASETKDIKSLEKTVKTHDSRMNRNILQANNNIINLFEKTTMVDQEMKIELKKISNILEALFAFVQSTTQGPPSPVVVPSSPINMRVILDKLNRIENIARKWHLNGTTFSFTEHNHLEREIYRKTETISKILQLVEHHINEQNLNKTLNSILSKYFNKTCTTPNYIDDNKKRTDEEVVVDEDTKKAMLEIFGPNPDLIREKSPEMPVIKKNKCSQNYADIIDIRSGFDLENCVEDDEGRNKKKKKEKPPKKRPYDIDVRGSFNEMEDAENKDYEENPETSTQTSDIPTEVTAFETEESTTDIFLETKPDDKTPDGK